LVAQVKHAQEEILEGKQRKKEIEAAIAKTKIEFSKDRQRFCGELITAKQALQQSQKQVIGTIRDRLKKFTEDFLLVQEVAKQTKLMSLRVEDPFDINDMPVRDGVGVGVGVEVAGRRRSSETRTTSTSSQHLSNSNVEADSSQRSFDLYSIIQRKVDELEKLRLVDEKVEAEIKHQVRRWHIYGLFFSSTVHIFTCMFVDRRMSSRQIPSHI